MVNLVPEEATTNNKNLLSKARQVVNETQLKRKKVTYSIIQTPDCGGTNRMVHAVC